jgi:hypothetical protein
MFTFDASEAKKADAVNSKINQAGKYKGTIERAVLIVSKKSTNGVELHFKSEAGESGIFQIYTSKKDGEKLMGHGLVMSMMACLRVKKADTKEKTYKVWDNEQKEEVQKVLTGLPDFEGKKIGVLIETEDGSFFNEESGKQTIYKSRPIPVMFFEAETGFTSTEIVDKALVAVAMEKRALTLKHRPDKNAVKASTQKPQNDSFGHANQATEESDIPF